MSDLQHMYSNDLTVDNSGDLAVVDGTQMGMERVIRRLMTAQGQYLFDLEYGAGLPGFLGNPAYPLRIAAAIREQLALEDVVAQSPLPAVGVRQNDGTVTASVQYIDSNTGESAVLDVPISVV